MPQPVFDENTMTGCKNFLHPGGMTFNCAALAQGGMLPNRLSTGLEVRDERTCSTGDGIGTPER